MIGDPNWLYSTIAQSSAAIVAIVGGFITATVLMLMAERRSLAHQRADKKVRLEALKSEEARLVDLLETRIVEMFFKTVASEITAQDELPSLQELLQRHPGWDLNPEILEREYSKMSKLRLKAREFIYRHSDRIDVAQDVEFNEWVMTNKLDIPEHDYEILEDEYQRMRERQQKVLAEGTRIDGWPVTFPDFKTTKVGPMISLWEQRELGSIKDGVSNVRHDKFMLEHEVADLDERLTSFRDPQDLRWGLCVLAYLAGVGILFPLIVIAKEAYFPITKGFAIGFFFSGLIAIFSYIVFQINRLRR